MRQKPVIDGFEFAEAGRVLRGKWPISDFSRLRELLHAHAGAVDYTVSGVRDREGRPALRVELHATLSLACRRCLQPLDYPVAVDALLTLAHSQSEVDADPVDSDVDRVVAGRSMPVCVLLEDELLLSVPFAPSHPDCAPERVGDAARNSPFARLRGLLDSQSPGGRDH